MQCLGRPHGLHRCSPRQGDRPGAARSGVVPGRAAELHRAGMRHIGHERMLIVETNLMDEPRSAEDLPDPVPAQQVAPVLGVGRIDWVAEPGAPDGCGPRVSCGRAHHVRPCRGERGLRVLQGAASCAGVWVSSSDWVAGKGPALRLGAWVAGYLDDQPDSGGARARRSVPGWGGGRLAGSAQAPACCGRGAQQRDQQVACGWPCGESTCPHGRWTNPASERFPLPAPVGRGPGLPPSGRPPSDKRPQG